MKQCPKCLGVYYGTKCNSVTSLTACYSVTHVTVLHFFGNTMAYPRKCSLILILILKKLRHLRASARLCLWKTPYKHEVRHAVTG